MLSCANTHFNYFATDIRTTASELTKTVKFKTESCRANPTLPFHRLCLRVRESNTTVFAFVGMFIMYEACFHHSFPPATLACNRRVGDQHRYSYHTHQLTSTKAICLLHDQPSRKSPLKTLRRTPTKVIKLDKQWKFFILLLFVLAQ